jgi:integrase
MTAILHKHVVVHHKAVGVNELPDLMRAINEYDKEGDKICTYALQLIALTFVRKSELTYAKWQEFDLEKALWKIPAERMKMRIEHVVPLSKQAIHILRAIKARYPSDHYVINNGNANTPIPDNALMQALYWMGYKHKMTVHGFRAIASTILNEYEFRVDVIERQLAHSDSNKVRRAYNRAEYMTERIGMMQWWADYLENIAPFDTIAM